MRSHELGANIFKPLHVFATVNCSQHDLSNLQYFWVGYESYYEIVKLQKHTNEMYVRFINLQSREITAKGALACFSDFSQCDRLDT